MMKICLAIILSMGFFTFGTIWARKPAVEPVLGISIDNQKTVPPGQAQGFDFNSGKAKNLQTSKEIPNESFPWSLIALLSLLPLAISIVIVKKSRKIKHETQLPDNAINLDQHRKKKKDKEETLRKAS